MNPSNDEDYSSFGFAPTEESSTEDYSEFGFQQEEPKKEKVGKFKSALLGLWEGTLAIPGLIQYGVNEYSKAIEKGVYGEEAPNLSFEQENPILAHLGTLPESEDEAARRFRVAGQVLPLAATGGIPGIIAGLVGSQAGQTIREVWGKEGKFDEFGWGEGLALATDFVAGFGTNVVGNLVKGALKGGANAAANRVAIPFSNPKTGAQRKAVQLAIEHQGEALDNVVNGFSQAQIRGFEEVALEISPSRYTELNQSNASQLQRQAQDMYRNTQLSIISPIAATPEQAGGAIQQAANLTFDTEVLAAERTAYRDATLASAGLEGEAPRTLEQAIALRNNMTRNEPTPEQRPVIAFLDDLISDLQTTTPASVTPASSLLDANGLPLTPAIENPATTVATRKSANELVDLVQKSNQAVNYGSEVRLQSHRLSPIIRTLREETGEVLAQRPEAVASYRNANLLHARNAEVWGTKYMRNVRFSENPENIIAATRRASNMRNLKQAVQNPGIQGIAERSVVGQITETGSASSNRTAVTNLSPELTPVARGAANDLINVKDPMTTVGGRAAVRNDILKDAAQAVNTGKRPTRILELMQTPKGYQLVRESLNASPESRELFHSFERLFMEDIFSSLLTPSGEIDFTKARHIFKNPEVRNVVEQIGGEGLIRRFRQLENFSHNFERNMRLYSRPETQSLFKALLKHSSHVGLLTTLFHSLHMPWPVIIGLVGTVKGAETVTKAAYASFQKRIFSNPRALHYLERVSQATTVEELAKQLPRLIAQLDKEEED